MVVLHFKHNSNLYRCEYQLNELGFGIVAFESREFERDTVLEENKMSWIRLGTQETRGTLR